MRFGWILVTTLVLALGAAVLPGAAPADVEAADTNDDGVVSLPEAKAFDAKIKSGGE